MKTTTGAYIIVSSRECMQDTIEGLNNGSITVVQLRNMTHNELPWKTVYQKGRSNPIPHDLLIEEFQTVKTNRRLLDVLDAMQDEDDIVIPAEITNSDQFIAWIRS